MSNIKKRSILTYLLKNPNESYITYAEYLDKAGVLRRDYKKYMTTVPVNLDLELSKRYSADYDTICALLSAVIKEAEIANDKFKEKISNGIVNDLIVRILVETYMCGKTPTYRFYFHIISLRVLSYGLDYMKIIRFMQRNEEIVKSSFAYSRLAYNENLISEKDFRLGGIDDVSQTIAQMMKEEKKEEEHREMKQRQIDALEYIY